MTELANAEARPVEARLLHMVFPDHTNHLGTLFGGQALAWMDMSAFIAASRYARTTVVTARSEQVDFNQPIHKARDIPLHHRNLREEFHEPPPMNAEAGLNWIRNDPRESGDH